jgi:hypothetical protein
MRIWAVILIGVFSFLSVGCDPILQPSQQGQWSDSNFHNPKDKVSHELERSAEPPEK